MNQSRIQIAKRDIIRLFDELPNKVLTQSKIGDIFSKQRDSWRLAQNMTVRNFIDFLIKQAKLKRFDFPFPYRKEIRYTWGEIPLLEILLALKSNAYFSHYTAMKMHGLTEQVPKTIYLNHEQPNRPKGAGLEQGRIDLAFSRAARVSQNAIEFGDLRICLINGMQTGQLGVIDEKVSYDFPNPIQVRFTNIERTLIDITVRPNYAGGVFEVLKAYRLSQGRVSINKIAAMLQKLQYVYPYHQAIGFYLERAGYKDDSIALLRRFPMEFNFYLTHQISNKVYIKDWRLYIPKGF